MKDSVKNCEVYRDMRSTPSVTEKGKTFQLDNKSKREVACIKIDDCVFKQADGIKCDYLFEVESQRKLFYVELKGSDITKALNQITETLKQTINLYPDWVYEARVIASGKIPASIAGRKEFEYLRSNCKGGRVTIHHKKVHIESLD
jgi:hypothetical protein